MISEKLLLCCFQKTDPFQVMVDLNGIRFELSNVLSHRKFTVHVIAVEDPTEILATIQNRHILPHFFVYCLTFICIVMILPFFLCLHQNATNLQQMTFKNSRRKHCGKSRNCLF